MNRLILSIIFVAAATSAFASKKKHPAPAAQGEKTFKSLPIGSRIPFEGVMITGADGRQTSFHKEKTDKGLLVMFSCNTCPYVIKAQPRTREAMAQAQEMHIGMVVLNSNEGQREAEDAPIRMNEYAGIQQYTVPYLIDEQSHIADAFGATRTPEVFLFDGNGKLVYKGALEDNPSEPEKSTQSYVVEAMRAMVEGKPVHVAETKSIGCSIKRKAI